MYHLMTSNIRRFDSLNPRLIKVDVFAVDTGNRYAPVPVDWSLCHDSVTWQKSFFLNTRIFSKGVSTDL